MSPDPDPDPIRPESRGPQGALGGLIKIIRINFIYIFIQLPSFRKIPKKVVLKQNTKFDIAEKEKS